MSRMRVRRFEYFADHMEPVLFRDVILGRTEFFRATAEAVEHAGLSVWAAATARISYLLNMLSHPYGDMRECGRKWVRAFIDLAQALGASYISGHYDLSLIHISEPTRPY